MSVYPWLELQRTPQAPPSPTGGQWEATWNPQRQQSNSVDGVGTSQGMAAKQEGEEDKQGQWEEKSTGKQKNKTALTLLDDCDQSLFPKVCSSMTLLACLGLCWFLFVQLHFPLLPCNRILVLYVPLHTIRGSFQVSFPQYLQSASCTALTLWLLSFWFYPYIFRLTPDTTTLIFSSWYPCS